MRRPGVVDMISWGSGLVLAVPMGVIGFEFVRQGSPLLGGAFLALAVVLVWFPEYVRSRLSPPWQGLHGRMFGSSGREDN